MRCSIIMFSVAMALCLNLSGCGISRQSMSRETNDKLMDIQVGMDRGQVLSILGKPYKREAYGNSEYLIYETNHWASRRNEKERFTPILLEQGKVVGWGRNYYNDVKKSKIEADINIKSQ